MSRLFSGMMTSLRGMSVFLKHQHFSKNTMQLMQTFARGNSVQTICHQQTSTASWNVTFLKGQDQIFRCPAYTSLLSNKMEIFLEQSIVGTHLPSFCPSNLNNKFLENMVDWEQEPNGNILNETKNYFVYMMGSLLKKRRKKMNRQKYKKRRKRDRFRRAALKNLREKKRQRKERATARKQLLLSKMVVNKAISKRRARYLSHKLLPGVMKGQSIN